MSGPLAVVARFVRDAATLRTATGDMARRSAVVAGRHVGTLKAVFCEVAFAVAAVAARGILLAVASIVPGLVALVALLPVPVEGAPSVAAPRLGTLAREVTWLVAFVTYTPGTHC